MKKIFAFCLLITIGLSCFAQEDRLVSLNEAIRIAMQYLSQQIAPNSKVVVLNFAAPTEELSNYIIEDMIDYIVNNRTLTVVDRQNLEVLRRELNFQMSGEVSDETAQSIGKMLGAQSIISGSISPLGRNYRFRVQAVEVETAAFQGGQTITVIEDATLAALLGNSYIAPRPPFTQKFAVGAQAGTLYGLGSDGNGFYTYHNYYNDMRYKETTGKFGFLGSIYGAFAFNSVFRLQLGVNITMSNLYLSGDISGLDYQNYREISYDVKYLSLEIPLIPFLYFNPSTNFLLRIGVGPYLSLPLKMETDVIFQTPYTQSIDFDAKVNFGLLGGFGLGYRIGSGNLVLDLRYLMDFLPTGSENSSSSLIRRGITAVIGYEHWF